MRKLFLALVSLLALTHLPVHADESAERAKVVQATRTAFDSSDFKRLENLSKQYSTQDKRTRSGAQKISLFDDGITQAIVPPNGTTEEHVKKAVSLTAQWAKENPTTPLAHILHARALFGYAYFFRGTGYANTVSPSGWQEFEKYSRLAAKYLEDHKNIASKDTGWHVTMINIGRGLSFPRKQVMLFASDGLAKNPDDDRLYYMQLESLLPKWGGSAELVDQFINNAAKNTAKSRGMELYARLYSATEQNQFQERLFVDSKIEWKKMKRGLEDWNRRYPTVWNKNIFGYFACLAGDKDITRKNIVEIASDPILFIWGTNGAETYNQCKSWAQKA